MKKISIILPIIITLVTIASCNKLDENPQGTITTDNFYKTQNDAIAAVTAVYSTLTTDINNDFPVYGRNLNLLVDNPSDNQVYSPSNTNPDVRALGTATYVSTNDRVHKIYAQLYWGIDKANVAIDKIPTIPADKFYDATHSALNLVREARFIRALLYFNLVRLFGDVPLVLHDAGTVANANILVGRTPKDSVYRQIIEDLDSATSLPAKYSGVDVGRVTSGAAHALLGKVYVTRQDWANAVKELKQVITAGTANLTEATTGNYGYDLFPKFVDAFQAATKNGKEHIFSAQFNGTTGGFTSTQNISSFTWSTSAYTSDIPADKTVIENVFNVNDQRRSVSFYDSLYNTQTGKWVKWPYYNFLKFVDQSTGFVTALQGNQGANSKINFPVIRYADVLLLYAEALNELNGGPTPDAYVAINIIRARAFNSYTSNGSYTDHTYDVSALNQSSFRDTVFTERRREFIQESQRWFDLVRRTDKGPGQYYLQSVYAMPGNPKAAATLKDTLFPIPQSEIDLYQGRNPNFKQNPGWE
ncbi:RagB/SusD family nutrient uptake outer membrane protein [Ferruginibacter albus]|uniref:RagB/SusD family nutrient uptake outer membrane protein n=1 Tax=Ferruginibacter albus TaxID=2875540 RepID=UPI001CC63A3D|nr:RagB/SusD family nutrient uptake outer membrane protein [Ferruginibacter albus]UAY52040.1 RagB/SusD family nutrient uptake outer membrane protein [Ferruginibacter albus]